MMHNFVYATLWKLVEKKKNFNGENPLHLRIDEPTLLFVSARMLHRRCQRVEAAENDAIGHEGNIGADAPLWMSTRRERLRWDKGSRSHFFCPLFNSAFSPA